MIILWWRNEMVLLTCETSVCWNYFISFWFSIHIKQWRLPRISVFVLHSKIKSFQGRKYKTLYFCLAPFNSLWNLTKQKYKLVLLFNWITESSIVHKMNKKKNKINYFARMVKFTITKTLSKRNILWDVSLFLGK